MVTTLVCYLDMQVISIILNNITLNEIEGVFHFYRGGVHRILTKYSHVWAPCEYDITKKNLTHPSIVGVSEEFICIHSTTRNRNLIGQ